jgi:hypothetical protein
LPEKLPISALLHRNAFFTETAVYAILIVIH